VYCLAPLPRVCPYWPKTPAVAPGTLCLKIPRQKRPILEYYLAELARFTTRHHAMAREERPTTTVYIYIYIYKPIFMPICKAARQSKTVENSRKQVKTRSNKTHTQKCKKNTGKLPAQLRKVLMQHNVHLLRQLPHFLGGLISLPDENLPPLVPLAGRTYLQRDPSLPRGGTILALVELKITHELHTCVFLGS
jgi:hypothetical protein